MSIFNPTLQLVIMNLYTKFVLNGCGDICVEKSGENEKGTTRTVRESDYSPAALL